MPLTALPLPMAGLPARRAMVSVGPPLLPGGARPKPVRLVKMMFPPVPPVRPPVAADADEVVRAAQAASAHDIIGVGSVCVAADDCVGQLRLAVELGGHIGRVVQAATDFEAALPLTVQAVRVSVPDRKLKRPPPSWAELPLTVQSVSGQRGEILHAAAVRRPSCR